MDIDKYEEKIIELYRSTNCCKNGNCNGCPRNKYKGSNTYLCKSELLYDCNEIFDMLLEDL